MDSKILNIVFSILIVICMMLIVIFSVNFAKDFVKSDGQPLSRGAKIASIVVPAVVGFLLIPAIAKNTVGTYRFERD